MAASHLLLTSLTKAGVTIDSPFYGRKAIGGIVDVIITPAPARVVRLHHRGTGKVVRETLSAADGSYQFLGLDDNFDYYVIAFDVQPGGYNAAIADMVRPQ